MFAVTVQCAALIAPYGLWVNCIERKKMSKLIVRCAMLVALFLLGTSAQAFNSWVGTGPLPPVAGDRVIGALAVSPDGQTVYAGNGSGTVFKYAIGSTNANLSALTLSSGSLNPAFDSATTGYTASVANAVSSITVTPTAANGNATVTVNGGSASGTIALNVGSNTVTVLVTAQDSAFTKTYTVTVTRAASANANLAGLTLSGGALNPAFAAATTSYTASVANAVSSLTATPTVADATATVKVNGSAVASGSASGGITLNVGDNTITVLVTAQDGTATKTYTVTVTRDAPGVVRTYSSGGITASFTGGGSGCGFTVSRFIPVTGVAAPPPAGVTFPYGLFDFSTGGCTPGSKLDFTITYPQALSPGSVYWKYGPTPGDHSYHWYQLPAVIAGNVATFSITDGGLGDDDLNPTNGAIVDQGGAGFGAAGIPTLSEWGMAILSGLLMPGALVTLRRQHR
jgi:hypothetical protein